MDTDTAEEPQAGEEHGRITAVNSLSVSLSLILKNSLISALPADPVQREEQQQVHTVRIPIWILFIPQVTPAVDPKLNPSSAAAAAAADAAATVADADQMRAAAGTSSGTLTAHSLFTSPVLTRDT